MSEQSAVYGATLKKEKRDFWKDLESNDYDEREEAVLKATRERFGIVIDTGSWGSIPGERWAEDFRQQVLQPKNMTKQIEMWDSDATFRGISGHPQHSDTRSNIPIGVGGENCTFESQILD
eukprot:3006734-Alexandrium_andersonii.AAC.1